MQGLLRDARVGSLEVVIKTLVCRFRVVSCLLVVVIVPARGFVCDFEGLEGEVLWIWVW